MTEIIGDIKYAIGLDFLLVGEVIICFMIGPFWDLVSSTVCVSEVNSIEPRGGVALPRAQ